MLQLPASTMAGKAITTQLLRRQLSRGLLWSSTVHQRSSWLMLCKAASTHQRSLPVRLINKCHPSLTKQNTMGFNDRYIYVASKPEQLSVPHVAPTAFLDQLDMNYIMTCSANNLNELLLQISHHYFEHLVLLFPWLQSHHQDIYKQLKWAGHLDMVTKDIRSHPNFLEICHKLEESYRECGDQELSLSLLLLCYLGVSSENTLVKGMLLEVTRRIPLLDIQVLTTVSWVFNILPGWSLATKMALAEKMTAICSEADSLSPEDIQNLCLQQMNLAPYLSDKAVVNLSLAILNQKTMVFTEPQHLATVASFFGRSSVKYLLEKHDILAQFESWTESFKDSCIAVMDRMNDYHIGCICKFLRFIRQYDSKMRKLFEKQSLSLLDCTPGIGRLSNLIISLSPSTSKDIIWPFEERLHQELDDADDYVTYTLVRSLFTSKQETFSKETIIKLERLLVERGLRFLRSHDEADDILILLGMRCFVSHEHGIQFFQMLLDDVANSADLNANYLALASCYLMSKAQFPDVWGEVFQRMALSLLYCSDACALQLFIFLSSVQSDCQSDLQTAERHVNARLRQAISEANDIFYFCYIIKSMISVDASFKFRDDELLNVTITKLRDLLENTNQPLSASVFLSVIDILRQMKYYAPEILNSLVNHFCQNKHLHQEKIIIKLLCTLSVYSHRSKVVDNFIPSVIKLINEKAESKKYKDVMLMLNYLMRLQVFLEDELKKIFSFEFMTDLGDDQDYAEDPARQILVELTRRCILEHPELDIPWFHDEYCKTHIVTAEPQSYITFRDGVAVTLKHVLGGEKYFKRWTYTPYFYSIDFECILDECNQPVNMKAIQGQRIKDTWQRVAILLLTEPSFWIHSDILKGSVKDKHHHLELMGYRIIQIHYKDWFSKLASSEQRVNYLREQLLS